MLYEQYCLFKLCKDLHNREINKPPQQRGRHLLRPPCFLTIVHMRSTHVQNCFQKLVPVYPGFLRLFSEHGFFHARYFLGISGRLYTG